MRRQLIVDSNWFATTKLPRKLCLVATETYTRRERKSSILQIYIKAYVRGIEKTKNETKRNEWNEPNRQYVPHIGGNSIGGDFVDAYRAASAYPGLDGIDVQRYTRKQKKKIK